MKLHETLRQQVKYEVHLEIINNKKMCLKSHICIIAFMRFGTKGLYQFEVCASQPAFWAAICLLSMMYVYIICIIKFIMALTSYLI